MRAPTMTSIWQDVVVSGHRRPVGQGMAANSASEILSSSSCGHLLVERKRFSPETWLRSSRWTTSRKFSSSVALSRRSRLEHLALKGMWTPLNAKQPMGHRFSQISNGDRDCSFEGVVRRPDRLAMFKASRTDRSALHASGSGRQDGMVEDGGTLTKDSGHRHVQQANSQEEADADGRTGTGNRELEKTLRLVETAMLAASAGLAFFLSNLFRLEGYFGCFFPLPVVISSMRWGVSAGRKTTVATTLLLFILSGPLKAASYLLMHGFVGLAVGALWRWRVNWFVSLAICTVVRCFGALGFVLLSSWLLRENLLRLITINAHASISYMLAAAGINIIPTMMMIYVIFGILLILNCGSFVFLLHVLYVILLKRLGLETNTTAPGWVQRAA